MLSKTKILNVTITNETEERVLEYLFERLKKPEKKTFIITPNPEMLVFANRHLAYQDKINQADISLPDGIGLFFASGLLGQPLKERITGVDFLEKLCKEAKIKPLSMGFLGGRSGVAERTAERLLQKYAYLDIVFIGSEWNEKGFNSKAEKQKKKEIDILFVAFGVPKQEEWIYENLDSLPAKAAIGVGGAFDYLSGTVWRAPFIIRFIGFEWLFRLIVQPWRWRRQLALLEFIYLVVRQRLSPKQ